MSTTIPALGCDLVGLAPQAADIVLVLDSSSSLEMSGWIRTIRFAQRFVAGLNLLGLPEGPRVAAVSFSRRASVLFDFDFSYNVTEISNLLESAPFLNGGTRTANALQLTTSALLNGGPSSGRRSGAKAIVVIVTDGQSSESNEVYTNAVQTLHATGAEVFAVPVGIASEQTRLQQAVSEPIEEHLLPVESAGELASPESIQNLLLQVTCIDDSQGQTSSSAAAPTTSSAAASSTSSAVASTTSPGAAFTTARSSTGTDTSTATSTSTATMTDPVSSTTLFDGGSVSIALYLVNCGGDAFVDPQGKLLQESYIMV